MNEKINRYKEQEEIQHVTKLNVLVHPLWKIHPDLSWKAAIHRFDRDRNFAANQIIKNMIPHTESEVTLFMPYLLENDRREDLKKQIELIKENPTHTQWTHLFGNLILESGNLRKNVIMVPNIIENVQQRGIPSRRIFESLQKRGFTFDESTEIVVGGELLNVCLKEGVEKLLSFKEINRLKVDMRSTLTAGYLFLTSPKLIPNEYKRFMAMLEAAGYEVKKEEFYILVGKNRC